MFTIVGAGNNCFVLVACKYREIFYFLVTKGNLTLLFFTSKYIQLALTNRHHLFPQDVCYLQFQMVT